MNRLVSQHPGREIHVILDNLSTHKPSEDRWLKRHPNEIGEGERQGRDAREIEQVARETF